MTASTAIALRTHFALAVPRTLDALDDHDALALNKGTAHWRTLRVRQPRSDDDVRAYGRFIIDKARCR